MIGAWLLPAVMTALLCAGLFVHVGCAGPLQTSRDAWRGARHYSAGTEALERGDAQTALEELSEAARLVPHASEVRNHLGLAWWQLGELGRARSAFEQAIALDCDNEAARLNLARLDRLESADGAERAEGEFDGG
jgi:Flp pilus assembly protein TadD